MHSRWTITLLFLAYVSSDHLSYGQHILEDVPVSWIGQRPGRSNQCGPNGQFFYMADLRPEKEDHQQSVVRVNRDGSTLLFQTPDQRDWIAAFAAANNGLVVVADFPNRTSYGRPAQEFHLYHFDDQGNLATNHTVSFDFQPTHMAVTSSGKIVVFGWHQPNQKTSEAQSGGAVLDANDKILQLFEFPPTPKGINLHPARMLGGDGVAYLILIDDAHDSGGQKSISRIYSVATIGESGRVDINVLPVLPDDKTHTFNYLFGPGVAVEQYHLDHDTPFASHFDEYDLVTGKLLRTKIGPPISYAADSITEPSAATCYLGDEIFWMGQRRGDDPKLVHRVTSKLEAAALHK